MSSFGIGLGAFVQGFQGGMDMRDRIDSRNKQRTIDKGLKEIEQDTASRFDNPLSDEAYAYTMRRQELLYRQNGELEKAMAFRKFGESDAVKQGTRLFGSALLKAQTGDAAGALNDAIKAGQVNGYLDHGYELVSQDVIQDKDGNTVGFRLRVKGPDGKEVDQDVAVGDVGRLVATFANPQAAFESQQTATNEKNKKKTELDTYREKKEIDRQYTKPTGDDASNYRKVAEDLSKNDLDWGDRSPEEQDSLIRARLSAANQYANDQLGVTPGGVAPAGAAPAGATPAPGGKVIVDGATGQIVPTDAAIGLGGDQRGGASSAPGITPEQTPATAPAPQATKGASKEQIIADAANYAVNGGNPEYIAQRLMNAGVAEQDWPQALRTKLAKQTSGPAMGLGQ